MLEKEKLLGEDEEIAFWRGAIRRFKSDPQSSEFGRKLDPNRPIQQAILTRLRRTLPKGQKSASVLDVGCGPLSTIGKKTDDLKLEICGLDPLADDYSKLLKKHKLSCPHALVSGVAEKAVEYFGEAAFDYVHAENSLDHCQHANEALAALRQVCKPDAMFFFKVFVNEGEHNHYSGFHQWNFDIYNEKVIFWRPGEIHFLDEVFHLPTNFWIETRRHGPQNIARDYLHCEIHNTDMTHGFKKVGRLMARIVPDFSSIVLQKTEHLFADSRIFVHFGLEDGSRKVETLVWPENQEHYVLRVPKGFVRGIKLGQSSSKFDSFGNQSWNELWSAFVPKFRETWSSKAV